MMALLKRAQLVRGGQGLGAPQLVISWPQIDSLVRRRKMQGFSQDHREEGAHPWMLPWSWEGVQMCYSVQGLGGRRVFKPELA